jgi:hypothetical protein
MVFSANFPMVLSRSTVLPSALKLIAGGSAALIFIGFDDE